MSRMLYEENTDWNAWKKVNPSYYLLDLALDALARITHNAKLWKIHSALFYFAPSCSSSIFFHTFFHFTSSQLKDNKKDMFELVRTCPTLVSGCWTMAINLAWAFLYFLVFLVPPTHDITTIYWTLLYLPFL